MDFCSSADFSMSMGGWGVRKGSSFVVQRGKEERGEGVGREGILNDMKAREGFAPGGE